VERVLGIELTPEPRAGTYDAVMIAVAHDQFRKLGFSRIAQLGRENSVIYDIKSLFPGEPSCLRL